VADVERVNDAVESDLRQLTLMHTSVNETGQPLPYVDPATFGEAVAVYNQNYTRLSSTNSPTITSIEYDPSAAATGVVAYQNETGSLDDGVVTTAIDDLAIVSVNVTQINDGLRLSVPQSGADNIQIDVTPGGDVIVDSADFSSETVCAGVSAPVEIDIRNGGTEVRSGGDLCATFDLTIAAPNNVEIRTAPSGTVAPDGTYFVGAISATATCPSADSCIGDDPGETIDVNPTFHVVYQDANVAYETTFTAFGGDA
jgi:hypothetical protein